MSMVLHELATNAAKYGALSGDEGRVRVAWHVLDDELRVEWRQLDGPKARSLAIRVSDRRMITRVVTGEWVNFRLRKYPERGFHCRLVVPSESYEKTGEQRWMNATPTLPISAFSRRDGSSGPRSIWRTCWPILAANRDAHDPSRAIDFFEASPSPAGAPS